MSPIIEKRVSSAHFARHFFAFLCCTSSQTCPYSCLQLLSSHCLKLSARTPAPPPRRPVTSIWVNPAAFLCPPHQPWPWQLLGVDAPSSLPGFSNTSLLASFLAHRKVLLRLPGWFLLPLYPDVPRCPVPGPLPFSVYSPLVSSPVSWL